MAAASTGSQHGNDKELSCMAEHIARMDLKLDYLSRQVEECLSGIQGLGSTKASATSDQGHSEDSGLAENPFQGTSGRFNVAEHDNRISTQSRAFLEKSRSTCMSVIPPSSGRRPAYMPTPRRRTTDLRLSLATSVCSSQCSAVPHRHGLGRVQLQVLKFMSNPESSTAACIYSRLHSTLNLLVVLFSMIQGTTLRIINPDTYMGIECSVEAFFWLEITTLFVVSPDRLHFFLQFYNIIDILSALPLALRVFKIMTGGYHEIYTIILGGFVPVVRLLKAMRHFETSRLLANAFILAREAVPILVFYYAVVWLLFTAIIYAVEERSNVPSMADAMWLTMVTMTTIGYGDVIPMTGVGRAAASALVIVSTLYMAIPLGIIGSCFSAVWNDRDKVLLFERLRKCLVEASCLDVPRLFSRFDKTGTGSLDAIEFINMCASLKLGLGPERLMVLFNFWANEEDDRIEATKFQQILFPRDCLKALERETQAQFNSRRNVSRKSTAGA